MQRLRVHQLVGIKDQNKVTLNACAFRRAFKIRSIVVVLLLVGVESISKKDQMDLDP